MYIFAKAPILWSCKNITDGKSAKNGGLKNGEIGHFCC